MHFCTWSEDDQGGCPRVNTKKDFFQFTNLINAEFDKSDDFIRLTRNKLATFFKRAEANLFESRGPTLRCVNIL